VRNGKKLFLRRDTLRAEWYSTGPGTDAQHWRGEKKTERQKSLHMCKIKNVFPENPYAEQVNK
jgi:hypothetical protein